MRILIADDDEGDLEILRRSVMEWRHGGDDELVEATDCQGAMSMIKQHVEAGQPFDVVITDLMMPGGSGAEVAALAWNSGSRLILCTGVPAAGRLIRPDETIPVVCKGFHQQEHIVKALTRVAGRAK